jgi:hypothetical protein
MTEPEVRQTVIGDRNIVTGTGDVNIVYTLPPAEAEERRSLLVLLERVRQFWIVGVLDSSVHGAALLELGTARMSDAVEHPWERILELPGEEARAVPAERGVEQLFDEATRALLVLGAEGSGKTTVLLQLARALVTRAERDPTQPVPVVLNLASWKGPSQDLGAWIVEEMQSKYYVPPRIGRAWIEGQRLALLLDGLDEVAESRRAECVRAANQFLRESSMPGIAVCSRLEEYLALPHRLAFGGAVRLEPLSPGQVQHYLEAGGERMAGLRELVARDEATRELARSPLLLSVMTLAYQDAAADTALAAAVSDEQRRAHIYDTYLDRMFARRGREQAPYAKAETLRGLGSLARHMLRLGQRTFLIESLQPSWLATRVEVVIYALLSRMLAGLALGAAEAMFLCVLVFVVKYRNYSTMVSGVSAVVEAALLLGLLFGLAAGVADACRLLMRKAPDDAGRSEPWWTTGIFVASYLTIFGALLHLIGIGLSRAPFGLVWALLFALRGRRQSLYLDVQPVFGLTWSLRRAVTGAVAGTLIGLVLSALSLIVEGETINILGLLTLSSVYTLIGASFGGITRVLGAGASRTSGIRLTIRAALRGALLTGVIAGGVLGLLLLGILLVASLVQPESWQAVARVITQAGFRATPLLVVVWCAVAVLVIAVPVGIYFAVFGALWYGALDAGQHAILRLMLRGRGAIPSRLPRFLDYGTRLIFLQRVGGGYRFVHGSLMEHIAGRGDGGTNSVGTVSAEGRS